MQIHIVRIDHTANMHHTIYAIEELPFTIIKSQFKTTEICPELYL